MTDHQWYGVFDQRSGDLLQWFDDLDSCHPYAGGDYHGHCGGCDMCLLMQARHYNMLCVRVLLQEGETLGDALGRVGKTVKPYIIKQPEGPDLRVAYAGAPPCLWCRRPVQEPSVDGPLVCGLCDAGLVRDEQGIRKWTASEYRAACERRRREVERVREFNG